MVVKVNEISGMPSMSATLNGWKTNVIFTKVSRQIVNGISTTTKTDHQTRATVQPLSPQQISLKSEGQRAWSWWQIHVDSGEVELIPDDRITLENGLELKVMAKRNYSRNGYFEYHAIEDYDRGSS